MNRIRVTFQGNPMHLVGKQLKPGDQIPSFRVFDKELQPVNGSELKGVRVFAAVPSLDTGVCDMEIKALNQKASAFQGVELYAVSMDLPFAQARWCGGNGVSSVRTLSDYYDRSFANATGTLVEELALLTRAAFVVGRDGKVRYAEYVPEITSHPDYDRLYDAIAQAANESIS